MSQSKYFHSCPGSDESLAFLLYSNQSLYPGSACEATMLQEALAVNDNPPAEKKPNYFLSIGLEILVSLLLVGLGLLIQLNNKPELATPNLTVEKAENIN